jgi:serine/threonine-protein kinase
MPMSEGKEQNNRRPKGKGTGPTRSFDGSVVGPGGQIGPFRIEQELGRGGAGVVYLAHDTKLDRSVAIKSLPAELMENPKARTRFKREARLLASLNHPNIATIYEELQEAEGLGYLILEYIPGQTLAERIAGARLKSEEALSIAQQIAEAVATAHEHDVIHRDLKPGNIKITPEGKVKVLDFGLAKALGGEATDQQSTVTEPGRIIGTPAYMSPEQARGQETDKRCDIWSFGCVLYEMLTGKVPFEGETVSDTLAAILDREPDWHALPQATPSNIQILLRRCLEKDPRRRLRDIGDASIEIHETLDLPAIVPSVGVPSVRPSIRALWKIALLCAFAGLVVGVIAMLLIIRRPAQPVEPRLVRRYSILLDSENPVWLTSEGMTHLAFTPDGSQLIYVAGTNEDTWLVRRPMDSFNSERISGTNGAQIPWISPDGRWLAFTAKNAIWRVPFTGGNPEEIAGNPLQLLYIWESNNTLILGTKKAGVDGLSRFDLKTKKSEPLTMIDPTEVYVVHAPYQLVQEAGTLFFIKARSPDVEEWDLFAISLKTGEMKLLVEGALGEYVQSGHLVYLQRGHLMAAPFNIKTLQITGDTIDVTEHRMATDKTVPSLRCSRNGTLVYAPAQGPQERNRELVWVNLDGQEERLGVPWKEYTLVRVSGDITNPKIAAEAEGRIWIYDTSGASLIRPLTFVSDGICERPIWMLPDHREIVFVSLDSGRFLLKRKAVDFSGEVEVISVKPSRWLWFLLGTCIPNENKLMVGAFGSEQTPAPAMYDAVLIDLDRDGEIQHLPEFVSNERDPAFSPDGKWFAYVVEEQGRDEVFVTAWPMKGKWPVSTEGGREPVWALDGKTIYYRDGKSLVAVPVETEGGFIVGRPKDLFDDVYVPHLEIRNYDIHPDGKRFLMIKEVEGQEQAPITELHVVENWFEELKHRVPIGKKQ